jgi:hypothetical protein
LFGASIRSDPEFASAVDGVVRSAAEAISELIEIPASDEQRLVLANALVGMAEAVGRRVLSDAEAEDDADRLAHWIAELAWFGLRGIRAEETSSLFRSASQ